MVRRLLLLILMTCILTGCGIFKQQKRNELSPDEVARVDSIIASAGPPKHLDIKNMETLSPDVIIKTYEENPLRAQTAYENQWIKITGTLVAGPTKATLPKYPALGLYTLTLSGQTGKIHCSFMGKAKENELMTLNKGQEVTVIGKVSIGLTAPTLTLCSLVPAD